MSRKANPTAIGAFIIGGLVLLIVALGYLASGKFFQKTEDYITYFEEAAGGLKVGAAVRAKGVTIGEVLEIGLYQDHDTDIIYVPVRYNLNLTLMEELGLDVERSDSAEEQRRQLAESIDRGLRAKMKVSSIVSGVKYIELDYVPDPSPGDPVMPEGKYAEIPAQLSPMAGIGKGAGDVLASLSKLDIEGINNTLLAILQTLDSKAEDLDLGEISESLVSTIDSYKRITDEDQLPASIGKLNETLENLNRVVSVVEASAVPLLANIDSTSAEMTAAMRAIRASTERTGAMLSPESGLRYNLESTLSELSEAAKAIRRLAELLERNPSALLRGQQQDQN